eukprot:TRINITY_DN7866_c0_g1_i1.p1 TRINITY_DN7866_c0_g1~~TRINITY_DN7866_c0_g1_i1.p1  ORF type:complete len:308 (-),score=36.21 TRINITY_DN7866_c0_g1_i1:223-1071(-)
MSAGVPGTPSEAFLADHGDNSEKIPCVGTLAASDGQVEFSTSVSLAMSAARAAIERSPTVSRVAGCLGNTESDDWELVPTDAAEIAEACETPVAEDQVPTESTEYECRMCFESGEGLVAPCLCSGSSRWVHRRCLDMWRSKGQNPRAVSHCCECDFAYRVRSGTSNSVFRSRYKKFLWVACTKALPGCQTRLQLPPQMIRLMGVWMLFVATLMLTLVIAVGNQFFPLIVIAVGAVAVGMILLGFALVLNKQLKRSFYRQVVRAYVVEDLAASTSRNEQSEVV